MPAKIKTNPETTIYFLDPTTADSGIVPSGSPLVTFKANGTGSPAGHISNQYDLGPGPRTSLFQWRSVATMTGSGSVPGNVVEQYIASSDGVNIFWPDGNLGTVDGAVTSSDKRRNLMEIGAINIDAASGQFITSGLIQIFARYISLVWWNNTGILASSGNIMMLTPVPDEIEN